MPVLLCILTFIAPGETLRYDVRCGPMRLGTLELVTLEPDTAQDESCYHFRAVLESNRAFSFVFEARYALETWCTVPDMVTLRSWKKTAEKHFRAEWTADYDYAGGVVRYSDGKHYPLADSARDLLTLWYYFRTVPIELGDSVRAYSHTDRRDFRVSVRAARRARVRTPAGEFDCLELVPSTAGPLGTVYLACDSSRVPVVIKTRVGGAVVSAYLCEYVPGR